MGTLRERDVELALGVVSAAASGNGVPFGVETVDAVLAAVRADHAEYVEFATERCWRSCVHISHDCAHDGSSGRPRRR